MHNTLFIGNVKTNPPNTQMRIPSAEIVEGRLAACEMNTYYSRVGETLANRFQTQWVSSTICLSTHIPTMYFRFITEKETTALIKLLSINKSSQV